MAKVAKLKSLENLEPSQEVNMVTTSRELDSIFLAEYPHPFFPEKQYEAKEVDGGKGFIFYNLKLGELYPFLERCTNYSYLVLDAKTGKKLKSNKI